MISAKKFSETWKISEIINDTIFTSLLLNRNRVIISQTIQYNFYANGLFRSYDITSIMRMKHACYVK